MRFCSLSFTILILSVLGLTSMSALAQQFDRVETYIPMYERHILDPIARELTDVVVIGSFREAGVIPSGSGLEVIERFCESWPEKEVMIRTWVSMSAMLDSFDEQITFGAVHNPAEQKYDYADGVMRSRVSQALTETLGHVPADWNFIDEPGWSYAGIVDPCNLQISSSLCESLHAQYGHPADIGTIHDISADPKVWHDFITVRNQAMTDTLLSQANAIQDAGLNSSINFIPASLESTAVTAVDIAAVVHQGVGALDSIHIDPYYTLFAENPRFASFMFNLLDGMTPRSMPMVGWLDSVNGILERLAIKNPPPISMQTQIAQYLANGCDDLAIWHYVYLQQLGNLDSFAGMVRWLRQHQELFNGNPRNAARTGLYFSSNTFYLKDFFPKALTHGIGPYGQYFDVAHTYYSLLCEQIPVRVIALPFGQDYLLAQKLEQLDTLIIIDAKIVSDEERYAIDQWVRAGGTLVAIGQCGVMNEYQQPRAGFESLSGVTYSLAENRQDISFVSDSPVLADHSVTVEGSCENVYLRAVQSNFDYAREHELNYDYADKWPLYYRSEPLGVMDRCTDTTLGMLGQAASIGFELTDQAVVWAVYDDDQPAVIQVPVEQGQVIHIGPVDLFADDMNASCRQAMGRIVSYLAEPMIVLESPSETASIEMTMLEKSVDGNCCYIVHIVNHREDDQHIIAPDEAISDLTVRLQLPASVSPVTVRAFSPDTAEVSFEYVFESDDRALAIQLAELDVYTVFWIECQ